MKELESERPKRKRILVIGGGFAGLEFIKGLNRTSIEIVLVDRNNFHTFQPLLYQVASGSLSPDSIGFPFRKRIAKMPNVRFLKAEVNRVNPNENQVVTDIGKVDYDYLVLAQGSKTNFFGNKSLAQRAMQLKTIPHALDIRSEFLQEFEKAARLISTQEKSHALNFVVVGGGPTGVEVSGALAEIKRHILSRDYPEINPELMQIYLIQADPQLLTGFSEKSSAKAKAYLESMGVKVFLNTPVKTYEGKELGFGDGESIQTETVIWSAGVSGNQIEGFKEEAWERGRFLVDAYHESIEYKGVFALGDIALMKTKENPKGHPMVAPPAIQQAENLVYNFKHPNKKREFRYKDKGSMATIGRKKAVVDMGRIHVSGSLAWWIWMVVHLLSLIGFRNKLAVVFNWALKYFSWKNTIRLIIRPYQRANGRD